MMEMKLVIIHFHENNLIPIYKEFDGWKDDISKINKFEDLPKNFLDYVKFLENELKVPISIISVGPDRKQTIIC